MRNVYSAVFWYFISFILILFVYTPADLYATSNYGDNNINVTNIDGGNKRVYLAKNKSFLTQEMFEDQSGNPLDNTIFFIRYDYALKGKLILPYNSVLVIDGGSITNGNIEGNHSKLITLNDNVLINVTLSGEWNNDEWHIEWFETNDYSSLVNMLVRLNSTSNKNIVFKKSKHYSFVQPIVVFDQRGVVFDFNECVIEDMINDYYQASYNSFLYISNSSNVTIKNFYYCAINKNSRTGVGGYNPVVIRIGDSEYSAHDIEVKNIQVLSANAPSKLSLIDIFGDTYNCIVDGIVCNENINYGINCEYGKIDDKIKYPHNITIRNVTGYNISNSYGFLRASCGYNLLYENCHGHNVQCFIDIWSGDDGSDGMVNNVCFINCSCIYDDKSYIGDKEPIIIDNSRRSSKKNPEQLIYPIALTFTNCHIINKGEISEKHAMVIKDTQAPISISNCMIKGFKYAANIDYSRKANNPVIYDGIDNNITFNHCMIDGQLAATRTSVSFIDCYLKSNCKDRYLIKANEAARLFLQANTIECNNRDACVFVDVKAKTCTIINNRFTGSNNAYDMNMPCVISDNVYYGNIGKAFRMINKDMGINQSGSFAQKPKGEDIYVGYQYFNTDTHKIIIYGEDGRWYNSDGTEAKR